MTAVKLPAPAYFQVSLRSPTVNHPILMMVPEAGGLVRTKVQGAGVPVRMKVPGVLYCPESVTALLPRLRRKDPALKGQALKKYPVYKGSAWSPVWLSSKAMRLFPA